MITFVKAQKHVNCFFKTDSYFLPSSKNKKGVDANKKIEKEQRPKFPFYDLSMF